MDWGNEPATDQQLACLDRFGYRVDHVLTKREASEIIHDFREKERAVQAESGAQERPEETYLLHRSVEDARRALAEAPAEQQERCQTDLAAALQKRQEFWLDTCRDVMEMHLRSPQVLDLYRGEGCRFVTPTHEQAQEILQALDTIMPAWDKEHPELFYQTLELNFPETLRHI